MNGKVSTHLTLQDIGIVSLVEEHSRMVKETPWEDSRLISTMTSVERGIQRSGWNSQTSIRCAPVTTEKKEAEALKSIEQRIREGAAGYDTMS